MELRSFDTQQKALSLNLDRSKYGSIAEIGAGQEVARWFFRVGAASGTVAKTLSAYDMEVSDSIYGKADRYVSEERVKAMVDHEYETLVRDLGKSQSDKRSFFAFADTISAQTFKGNSLCQGWMAIRYQTEALAESNTIVLHVNMYDADNLTQQQAIGILGINLIYGVFFQSSSLNELLESLLDNLSLDRLSIDYIYTSGPQFSSIDKQLMGVKLLDAGVANAVLYCPEGTWVEPIRYLYKKPLAVGRRSFDTIGEQQMKQIDHSRKCLESEFKESRHKPLGIVEISMNMINQKTKEDESDVLSKILSINAFSYPVLLTNFSFNHELTYYLNTCLLGAPLHYVMGVSTLVKILHEFYYEDLNGGIIEAIGRMHTYNVKAYVFPMSKEKLKENLDKTGQDFSSWTFPDSGMVTVENMRPRKPINHLYEYLMDAGFYSPIPLID